MKNINWDDLRYFLSVARTGSLTGSAAELQVSQSTVSRRISALEQDLNTTLFARHATGYFLTDQGRDVLRKVSAVEDSITALHIGLADLDANTEGTIRLATPESLAVNMIIPALSEFISRYPKLRLEIISGVGVADLSRYEADLAIRLVRPQSGNLIMQRLGAMNSAIYASADYLQRHPAPSSDPTSGRAFIIWDRAYSHLPTASWLAKQGYDGNPALITSSVAEQYTAAKSGIGLALLPSFLVAHDADMIEVIPSNQVFSEDLWLTTHADLRSSVRIRAISEFLKELIARYQPAFSDLA